ncbi:CbrC family protein [Paenibacillus mangrovi]|uniref:CbrC family protein n=1 Tax=Paenibacillus mangrovi TaxID=2931978 RepID=UPI002467E8BE|nr:CbrC family protein [Paenibacillus mangrovi]
MYNQKFKYFVNPEANAEFTEEVCQFCGATKNCLEGEYFDRGDEVTSVCFDCLIDGKIVVNIPEYLQKKLYSHLKDVFSKENVDINKYSNLLSPI